MSRVSVRAPGETATSQRFIRSGFRAPPSVWARRAEPRPADSGGCPPEPEGPARGGCGQAVPASACCGMWFCHCRRGLSGLAAEWLSEWPGDLKRSAGNVSSGPAGHTQMQRVQLDTGDICRVQGAGVGACAREPAGLEAGFGVSGCPVIGAPGFCDQACELARGVGRPCPVPASPGGPTPRVLHLLLPQGPPKPAAATCHLQFELQTVTLCCTRLAIPIPRQPGTQELRGALPRSGRGRSAPRLSRGQFFNSCRLWEALSPPCHGGSDPSLTSVSRP